MAELFKPELESILPNWTKGAPKHVKAFFTCRTGGVSSGPYGGPNGIMGSISRSIRATLSPCVMMNRSIVTQCCPSEPKWLTQVHGTTVLCADDIDSGAACARSRRAMDFDERGCGLRDDGRLSARPSLLTAAAALLLLCTLAGAAWPTALCRKPLKQSAATVQT